MARVPIRNRPRFIQVYDCLKHFGPATVVSSRDTTYKVCAEVRNGRETIVGYPKRGEVRIHEDCWGKNMTCEGSLAGGIINGNPSIYDWYNLHCGSTTQQTT